MSRRFINEQISSNPATDWDWNPCLYTQFQLDCVYAGVLTSGGFSTVGDNSSNSGSAPGFGATSNIATACNDAGYNSAVSCLYYDVTQSGFIIEDGSSTLSTTDCDSGSACSWGTTVTFNNAPPAAINYLGYECDSGTCNAVTTGAATYNTLANCQTNCGGSTTIGCSDPFSTDYVIGVIGCDSAVPGTPDANDVSCCDYTVGCLDNRQLNNSYLASNSAWATGNVGPVTISASNVVADYAGVVQLNATSTSSPWNFPDATLQYPAAFIGYLGYCAYPTKNNANYNGCMDSTATNYNSAYSADCSNVPVLFNSAGVNVDPLFGALTQNNGCCTYTSGCTNVNACNYNSNATVDDSSCEYLTCTGCLDPTSVGFTVGGATFSSPGIGLALDCASAFITDNTDLSSPFGNTQCCTYTTGCLDSTMSNPTAGATHDCNGVMVITGMDLINDPTLTQPYYGWPSFGNTNYGTILGPGTTAGCCSAIPVPIEGCWDSDAINYDTTATTDGCLDVNGVHDTSANSCCQYKVHCTDSVATSSDTAVGTIPCNSSATYTDAQGTSQTGVNNDGSGGFVIYYGWIGTPIPGTVYLNSDPATWTQADDNYCCNYQQGCTDGTTPAIGYDASNIIDDDSCEYVIGCMDGTSDNDIGTGTGYIPCNPSMGNGDTFGTSVNIGNASLTTSPIDASYDATDDNDCCYISGCMDQNTFSSAHSNGATNYDPTATVDDGSCQYLIYGCDNSAAFNYNLLADGCESNILHPVNSAISGATSCSPCANYGDVNCCEYTQPEHIFMCLGDYDPNDANYDPSNPPSDGWGGCVEVSVAGGFGIQGQYQTVYDGVVALGITNTIFGDSNAVTAAANCAIYCGDCNDIPTAGCSRCAAGTTGSSCVTETDDLAALTDSNTYLWFDDIDDCNSSPACGLEIYGCKSEQYCEYWTQAVDNNNGGYTNDGSVTLPNTNPTWYLGLPGANGCVTPIITGCNDDTATNYDPSASTTCPNPYVDTVGSGPILPNDQFLTLADIPIEDIDWKNLTSLSNILTQAGMLPVDDCIYDCETQPLSAISAGGTCWTCTAIDGAPCVGVTTVSQYNNINQPGLTLIWSNDATTCCDLNPFCCNIGAGCLDDGTGVYTVFDTKRNLNNWVSGVKACNYDPNDPNNSTYLPDPTTCLYDCSACLDQTAFNYGLDCNGNTVTNPLTDAVCDDGSSPCCFVSGCIDSTSGLHPDINGNDDNGNSCTYPCTGGYSAQNFNPSACWSDGSCDYEVYGCTDANADNYSSLATNACNGTNGYPPGNYGPGGGAQCVVPGPNCCCTGDVGYNCDGNLCVPAPVGTFGNFDTQQLCLDSGCGDGRWKCQKRRKIKTKWPAIKMDAIKMNEAVNVDDNGMIKYPMGDPIGPGPCPPGTTWSGTISSGGCCPHQTWWDGTGCSTNDLGHDDPTLHAYDEDQIKWPDTPAELSKFPCCVEDPMGPHNSEQECIDNSGCGDCDLVQWKCHHNPSMYDTQTGKRCVQTTGADPVCVAGYCWDYEVECIEEPCEREVGNYTWECVGANSNIGGPCTQVGYSGWNNQQDCQDNTNCGDSLACNDPVATNGNVSSLGCNGTAVNYNDPLTYACCNYIMGCSDNGYSNYNSSAAGCDAGGYPDPNNVSCCSTSYGNGCSDPSATNYDGQWYRCSYPDPFGGPFLTQFPWPPPAPYGIYECCDYPIPMSNCDKCDAFHDVLVQHYGSSYTEADFNIATNNGCSGSSGSNFIMDNCDLYVGCKSCNKSCTFQARVDHNKLHSISQTGTFGRKYPNPYSTLGLDYAYNPCNTYMGATSSVDIGSYNLNFHNGHGFRLPSTINLYFYNGAFVNPGPSYGCEGNLVTVSCGNTTTAKKANPNGDGGPLDVKDTKGKEVDVSVVNTKTGDPIQKMGLPEPMSTGSVLRSMGDDEEQPEEKRTRCPEEGYSWCSIGSCWTNPETGECEKLHPSCIKCLSVDEETGYCKHSLEGPWRVGDQPCNGVECEGVECEDLSGDEIPTKPVVNPDEKLTKPDVKPDIKPTSNPTTDKMISEELRRARRLMGL